MIFVVPILNFRTITWSLTYTVSDNIQYLFLIFTIILLVAVTEYHDWLVLTVNFTKNTMQRPWNFFNNIYFFIFFYSSGKTYLIYSVSLKINRMQNVFVIFYGSSTNVFLPAFLCLQLEKMSLSNCIPVFA